MKKTFIISILCGLIVIILSISISSIGLNVNDKSHFERAKTENTTQSTIPEPLFPYPETMTPEIEKNKKLLIEHLEYYDISAEIIAKNLYTVGVKEIKTIRVDIHEKGDEEFEVGGACMYLITDSAGKSYYIETSAFGGYLKVKKDGPDGELIYGWIESVPIEAPQKWWEKLPAWLRWILRYILFGWAWMKY